MKVYRNSKIFIIAPDNKTGGVESLHQLCQLLNRRGLNAGIVYLKKPSEKLYPEYDYKVFEKIEDSENNLLIIAEIYPEFVYRYKNIQKAIWWLSFNNAPFEKYIYPLNRISGFINKLFRKFIPKIHKRITMYLFRKKRSLRKEFYGVEHLFSCEYVKRELIQKKIERWSMLEDYIFLSENNKKMEIKKKDLVAYNPKKGFRYTQRIIKNSHSLKFIPLVNMTKPELYNALKESKAYIDFGTHPGKDRIPREAILNDCIVITNKAGSAGNDHDVPIKYKVDSKKEPLGEVVKLIEGCILNYDNEIGEYSSYKKDLLGWKKFMEKQASDIFNENGR